jgi:DNA-binding winged helix-turn-helix (wHTH) protein
VNVNRESSESFPATQSMHYAFGSFTYDAKRGKLQCYGVDIPLKPKTGALLHYFLQHPHRIITKSELLDTLWRDEDVVEANLAQHVFLLRQAFTTYSPGETFIVTTARQGYCFVAPVRTAAPKQPTRGPSWKSYVEGRFLIEQRTHTSLDRAISAFERTIAADETHAAAHAGIAEANVLAAEYLFVEPHAAFRRARSAAERALDLDPDNVDAHVALGNVHLFYDWDFVAAYEALERATWLDPAHSSSRLDKARFLGIVGNYDAAVSEIASVLAREPFSLKAMSALAAVAILHNDFETVKEMSEAALSLDSSHALMQYYLISGFALSGRYREALDLFDSKAAQPYRQQSLAVAAFAAARAGLRSRANELIGEIDDASNWPYLSAFNRALPRIGLNEPGYAIGLLRRGIEDRDPWSVFILRYPLFAELPGIEELRHTIGPVHQ